MTAMALHESYVTLVFTWIRYFAMVFIYSDFHWQLVSVLRNVGLARGGKGAMVPPNV